VSAGDMEIDMRASAVLWTAARGRPSISTNER